MDKINNIEPADCWGMMAAEDRASMVRDQSHNFLEITKLPKKIDGVSTKVMWYYEVMQYTGD